MDRGAKAKHKALTSDHSNIHQKETQTNNNNNNNQDRRTRLLKLRSHRDRSIGEG